MSRVGKKPITIPSGVDIQVDGSMITVKGPKGTLSQELTAGIGVDIEDGVLTVTRPNDEKEARSKHGTYRALLSNMITGVHEGFKLQQELVGVGYKAESNGQILELNLGYSHNIYLQVPAEVSVVTETLKGKNPIITLESYDKQLLGQVAAKIRSMRKPEPFKGKGIRFVGEIVRRKAGKSASK